VTAVTDILFEVSMDKNGFAGFSHLSKESKALLFRYGALRETIGRSENAVFSLGGEYYIKFSRDTLSLKAEKDRAIWLENKVIAPRVVDYREYTDDCGKGGYLLTTAVKGIRACDEVFLRSPDRLIHRLAEAMAVFHALDSASCPFFAERSDHEEKTTVCHGDFCLPNILFTERSQGFVDVGELGKGDPWLDYAWCLWSLDCNLKTPLYRPKLLKALGIEFDEARYRRYTEE